jgi:very-short-patch-repair endonuclease
MLNRNSLDRPLRVYFAGKVNGAYEPDFWRREWFGVAQDDTGRILQHVFGEEYGAESIYAGPFLLSDDGNSHEQSQLTHECAVGEKPHNRELAIYEECLTEMMQADMIVARLSDGAYATMFEVGYARAKGIAVVPFVETAEMWFACPGAGWGDGEFADRKGRFVRHVKDALAEHAFFYRWRRLKCESPIESLVCEAMYDTGCWCIRDWTKLRPQCPINGYRVDLAIPELKLAFEFDGYTYHSDKAAFNRDRERDRSLTESGWTVMRFHGDEIRNDAVKIAKQINSIMRNREEAEVFA